MIPTNEAPSSKQASSPLIGEDHDHQQSDPTDGA